MEAAQAFVSLVPVSHRRAVSTHASTSSQFTRRELPTQSPCHRACPVLLPPARKVVMQATSSPSPAPAPTPSSPTTEPKARDAEKGAKLDRVICKFGGSSLADADRLREVTKLVHLQIEASVKKPVIVLSAMGPSTNELISAGERALDLGIVDTSVVRARAYNACKALGLNSDELVDPLLHNLDELLVGVKFIKELSPRTKDYLVSFGERLSVRIFAKHLRKNEGIKAEYVDAYDMGFVSNSQFTRAELQEETYESVKQFFSKYISDDRVAVVTGFIAKDQKGNITTLGRGGSDLTACVIGAALDISEVQVWKDVDGILSTDPRIVEKAVPVPRISFEEAAEMAFFGAKVLHPVAMQPAMRFNVPVRVKNSYNPTHPGTVIVQSRDFSVDNPVTAVSLKKNVQVVDVISTRMLGASGFLSEVFRTFANYNISIDMIATSEVSISMTLDNALYDDATLVSIQSELESIASVSFSGSDKAIVSLVSDSSRSSSVVGRAVSALDGEGVQVLMISQGASKYNVSVTIDMADATRAVRAIHDEFFSH